MEADINKECGWIRTAIIAMFSRTDVDKKTTLECLEVLLETVEDHIELLKCDM